MPLIRSLPRPSFSLRVLAAGGAFALAGSLSACSSDAGSAASEHKVQAGDDSCEVDDSSLDAGTHTFSIANVGSDVTEVYIYGKDGDDFSTIIGERENIGPGTTQRLEVDLAAGDYQLACKPGMTGDGIRTELSVTGSGGSAEASQESYDRELEFMVEQHGTVNEPAELSARSGERIEFKLENESDAAYHLELVDPSGSELGEGEAHTGQDAEFVAQLVGNGDYRLRVFRDGQEEKATTLRLTVTE